MAANYEEILKLIVDAGESVNTIEGLKKRIDELKKEMATMTIGGQDYVATKQKVDQLSKAQRDLASSSKDVSQSTNQARTQVKNFGDTSAAATASLLALGYAFSDMGQFGMGFSQGIRAIANNLSSLSISMVLLQQEAKATGTSMRTLLSTAIRGPYGLIVGFQLVIGLIDLWANSQRKAKEETKSLTESFEEQAQRLEVLKGALDASLGEKQYKVALETLNDEMGRSIELTGDLAIDTENYTKYLNLSAQAALLAAKAQKKLQEEQNPQLGFWQQAWINAKNFFDPVGRSTETLIALQNESNKSEEEYNEILREQVKLQLKLQELKKKEDNDKKEKRLKKEKKAYFNLNEELQEYLNNLNDLEKQLSDDIAKKDRELYIESLSEEQQEIAKVVEEYKELIKVAEEIAIMKGVGVMYSETSEIYKRQEEEINRIRKKYADKRAEQEKEAARKRREERRKQAEEELKENEDASKRALDRIHQTEQAKLQAASNTFGFLIALNQAFAGKTEAEQRKAFNRDKALRVAQATIDTYAAANAALASGGGTPLGFSMMAAAIAAGLANVTTILAQQFNGGSSSAPSANGGGIQGGYPYPMSGFSTIDPQFPDRTGSLNIIPRTQRIVVLESDITGAQKTSIDREQKAKVG
jgi:outer membrane murein-binding lipoprotein Lpp